MPNHVINELIFRGVDAEAQAAILAKICNAEGRVDFEILVPTPLNMWWGNVGTRHEKAFGRTALEWSRENWGTKWNAYDVRPMEATDDSLTVRFETAWAPPYPWLAAVFNGLKVSFEHNSLSEGGEHGRHGLFDITAIDCITGDPWREEPADEAMQRHLHKLLWGVEAFEPEPEPEVEALAPTTPGTDRGGK